MVGVLGVLPGLCRESADVAVPHVASGRAHRGSDGGFGDPGSVLLKMGTYGFIRFSLPMLPEAAKNPTITTWMGALSIIAIIYGALVSLMQKDWKKLVAYSSVSHLGFCTLGIFALNPAGIAGLNPAADQPRNFDGDALPDRRRGLRAQAYARDCGVRRTVQGNAAVYDRVSDRDAQFDGHAAAERVYRRDDDHSRGVPDVVPLGLLACAVGIALGAAYLLWLYQRTMLGDLKEGNSGLKDLNWREIAVFAPLLAMAFWIGLNPQPFFRVIERSVAQVVERVQPGYYEQRGLANPLRVQGVNQASASGRAAGN